MYIGTKKIKETKEVKLDELDLVEISFEDGTKETLSKLMYDATVSETQCDATKLREKRITPVVEGLLKVLRDWGIKTNELSYMSAVLNTSLMENEKAALKELWLPWAPTINTMDDVDLITIDRVLKAKTEKSIPSPYDAK